MPTPVRPITLQPSSDAADDRQKAPSVSPDIEAIVNAILEGQRQQTDALKANAPRKITRVGEYIPHTPFNPTGNKKRKLVQPVVTNGYINDIRYLSDEEIANFNALAGLPAGKYINKRVELFFVENGSQMETHIRYPEKTIADKYDNIAMWGPNWTVRSKKLADEATAAALARNK
jgi:hypothetical protein